MYYIRIFTVVVRSTRVISCCMLIVCRSKLSAGSAYIVMIQDRCFVNNSGNSEPIQTIFYTVMGVRWKPWAPSVKGGQNGREKKNLFARETRSLKYHFSAADLHHIWRQHVNQCGHQSIRKRIAKFFRNGITYPPKRTFASVSVRVLLSA